jgi:hypothetical protein
LCPCFYRQYIELTSTEDDDEEHQVNAQIILS